MNKVTLSDDRMLMLIQTPHGVQATLQSALPTGFTDELVEKALTIQLSTDMIPGQHRTARRIKLRGPWRLYLHTSTGPPTWWLPKFERDHGFMVGWLRLVVAFSIRRVDDET